MAATQVQRVPRIEEAAGQAYGARSAGGRATLGPLLLCLGIALVMMSPYASSRLAESTASDLEAHVSGVVEARAALLEGQFPLRVAPLENERVRYPLLSYYGNFPYTLGGLLCLIPGVNPYTAWKLVNLLALTAGGFFTYRCAYAATRHVFASAIAGVVFMTAPYMWTDLHARFAFTETVAFNLLPLVFYFASRCFASRRWGHVLVGGVAWSLLALSHNIGYLYGSLFFGMYFLSRFRPEKKAIARMTRVGLSYALGLVLTLWFLAPQLQTVKLLRVAGEGTPTGGERLTHLHILFSPVLATPLESNTPRLGLQIGWPVLAAAILALVSCFTRRVRGARRWEMLRLVVFFGLSVLLVAMPSSWWRKLPPILYYVQSSYRLLAFVTLFGALLGAHALAIGLKDRLRPMVMPIGCAVLALASLSYFPHHAKLPRKALTKVIAAPDMGNNGARSNYLLSYAGSAITSWFHPELDLALPEYGFVREGRLSSAGVLPIPTPLPGGTLVVQGAVPSEYRQAPVLSVGFDGRAVQTATLEVGKPFEARFALGEEPFTHRPTSLRLQADSYVDPAAGMAFDVHHIRFEYPIRSDRVLVSAGEAKGRTEYGKNTRCTVVASDPTLLQLPVLYYPGMLRVSDNGKPADWGNLGPWLAVRLAPGKHRIKATFAGAGGANLASGIAWGVVLAGGLMLCVRRLRRRRVVVWRGRPVFTARLAGVSFAVFAAILASRPLYAKVSRLLRHRLDCTYAASRPSPGIFQLDNAFDGDDATAWAVPGAEPVVVTITPKAPARLQKIVLDARQTGLYETWMQVDAQLYLSGQRVSEQRFSLTDADKRASQAIQLTPVTADRIELRFSSPVTVTRDGTAQVDPRSVSPGYREVELIWER